MADEVEVVELICKNCKENIQATPTGFFYWCDECLTCICDVCNKDNKCPICESGITKYLMSRYKSGDAGFRFQLLDKKGNWIEIEPPIGQAIKRPDGSFYINPGEKFNDYDWEDRPNEIESICN